MRKIEVGNIKEEDMDMSFYRNMKNLPEEVEEDDEEDDFDIKEKDPLEGIPEDQRWTEADEDELDDAVREVCEEEGEEEQ